MVRHREFHLGLKSRGFHLITQEVVQNLPELPQNGVLHLFILHTSAGLTINENADPTVLQDFESFFNYLVPEGKEFVMHDIEGPDDMPAHIKSSFVGSSVSIPIVDQRLHLGTWQGIYLCEFRNEPRKRQILATIYS